MMFCEVWTKQTMTMHNRHRLFIESDTISLVFENFPSKNLKAFFTTQKCPWNLGPPASFDMLPTPLYINEK